MKKHLPQQKGFVILFTILISAIILMIGLGIFSIATRETVLSGTAREAQYAFYAADAGVECALYAESAGMLPIGGSGSSTPFDCGALATTISGNGTYPNTPFIFYTLVDNTQKSCARVTVFDTDALSKRRIISQGYNVCDGATARPLSANPILVERDLDTSYATRTGSILDPVSVVPTGIPVNGVNPNLLLP